jgi:hypothetical protein
MGGFGKYRYAKTLSCGPAVLGIVSAASQYENTESILEFLSTDNSAPLLNLRFDGEDNPVNRLKIDSFRDRMKKDKV